MGFTKVRETIQRKSIDDKLRTRLWNCIFKFYFQKAQPSDIFSQLGLDYDTFKLFQLLGEKLLDNKPLDELKNNWDAAFYPTKTYFFACPWFRVYDFIQIVIENYADSKINSNFTQDCNEILEQELSDQRLGS